MKDKRLKKIKDEEFTDNDVVLAKKYNVSAQSITMERRRRNIPFFMDYRKQLTETNKKDKKK